MGERETLGDNGEYLSLETTGERVGSLGESILARWPLVFIGDTSLGLETGDNAWFCWIPEHLALF